MDVLGQFLLALVLLGAALCAEDTNYHGFRNSNCTVARVNGNALDLECFGFIYTGTSSKNTNNSVIDVVSEVKKNVSIQDQSFSQDSINNSQLFDMESADSNIGFYGLDKVDNNTSQNENATGPSPEVMYLKSLNNTKGVTRIKDNLSTNFGKNNSTLYHELHPWYNISKINVSVFSDIKTLDFSLFPNARTVTLNTLGHSIENTTSAGNITELYFPPSCLGKNISFINGFGGLTHLNLSHNSVRTLDFADKLPSLVILDVSHNDITDISKETLPESLQVLNISFNFLTNIGVVLKSNVIVLDIRKNNLSHVPVLQMSSLEELYLSDNNISFIEENAFSNITSVVVLDLRSNQLVKLEEKTFFGLNRLQWLDLSENKVVSLDPSIFQYLINLVGLSLSGNLHLGNFQETDDTSFLFGTGQRLQIIEASRTNLSRIPSTLTRSVRRLQLSNNFITAIQCGELESFPLVQILDLSHNLIKEIEEDALGRLDFLSDLVLSGNKLNNIPKSLPDQLQVLDLRLNSVEAVKNTDFLGLMELRVLILSWNNITVIEDGAFGQLISLEILDLSHNPIKSLSRTSFVGPRKLKQMFLVSLTQLISFQEPLSFPAPESSHLEVLNIESSPVLAAQLMDDAAALTMFHELYELNLNYCNISTLRSDLPNYLPRLHKLEIAGNLLNCTNIIWLVKWLQELNITMQSTKSIRTRMYKVHTWEEEGSRGYNFVDSNVTCAIPENLAGRKIISLKEEDFPDLKLLSPIPLQEIPTFEHTSKTYTTETVIISTLQSYVSPIKRLTTKVPLKVTSTELNINHTLLLKPLKEIFNNTTEEIPDIDNNTAYSPIEIENQRLTENLTRFQDLSEADQKWEYLKNYYKHSNLSAKPEIIFLNDSKVMVKDIDNHLNDSINSDAYLAHEVTPSSHPGMFVFLLVVGVILLAAIIMVASHCSQRRRGSTYHHHQDIEVTSFGTNELW